MPIYNRHFWPGVDTIGSPEGLVAWGPIMPVEVAVPDPLAQHLANTNQVVPAPVTGIAMIDTGATITAVDQSVFQALGVPPVSTATVGTAKGPAEQFVFPAKLSFPGTSLQGLDFSQVLGCDLSGQLSFGAERLIVLIGRDLLQYFILVYNGPGGLISLSH